MMDMQPGKASACLLNTDHESLGLSHSDRINEILAIMWLVPIMDYPFTVDASIELSQNLIAGCDHYGNEVCGGH